MSPAFIWEQMLSQAFGKSRVTQHEWLFDSVSENFLLLVHCKDKKFINNNLAAPAERWEQLTLDI